MVWLVRALKNLNTPRFGGAGIAMMLAGLLGYNVYSAGSEKTFILAMLALLMFTILLYVISDELQEREYGQITLGMLVGLNATANFYFLLKLSSIYFALPLAVICFLSAVPSLATNKTYQTLLSYLGFFFPTSWLAITLGMFFLMINLIASAITFNYFAFSKINKLHFEAEKATICLHGGLIRPMGGYGGFNLGNFTFLKPIVSQSLIDHETGHTLSLASLGSFFHFIGAVDENIYPARMDEAFAEYIAQSHDEPNNPHLAIWKSFTDNEATSA